MKIGEWVVAWMYWADVDLFCSITRIDTLFSKGKSVQSMWDLPLPEPLATTTSQINELGWS